jgi:PAS domain S-box-containing protein
MYTVLYVDDEPGLLELGKVFLEMSGSITIETAVSAKDGIRALEKTAFDCIVSDYQMPLMDGLAFLKFLREQNNWIPFILFTGRGREEVVIEAVNNGVDYYLQKGGDPKSQFVELEHKIRLAIEHQRTDNELKESRQRMKDIIDHLPDATFAIDIDGKVIAWNRAMEEMTGVENDHILGTGDHSYALPFYGTRRPILLDLVLQEDNEIEKKYPRITRKDKNLISEIFIPLLYGGKGAYLWFIASPLYDTHGNITGAIESIRDVTDRKKAEEALRESEVRYRAVIEDQTEFITRFLPDGTHVFVNEAYCRYFGKTPGEIIGTRFIPRVPDEDKEKVLQHFRKLTRDNPVMTMEHRIIMPDGQVRWQQWSDRAIFDEQGNLAEYQSVGRDITDRKIAEDELKKAYEQITAAEEELREQYDKLKKSGDALRESEEKYRRILENIQDVFYRSDRKGNLIMMSPSGIRMLGYNSEGEILGKNISATFYANPTQRDDLLKILNSNGVVTDFEVTLKKRDGTKVPVSTSSHTYYDDAGNFLGVEGTFRDITKRKNVEASLRASEEKYRSLVDNLNVGVYRNTAGFPGRWLWANQAFVRMFGYDSLDECMEHPVTDFYVNPDERKKFVHVMETDGFTKDFKLQLKKKDGSPISVSITAQAKKDPEGRIEWIDGICDDITALKETEERAKRYQVEMSSAIDYLPDATFIIDRKGTVIAWNRAMEEMTGVGAEDILGRGNYEYALPFYGQRRPILIDLIFASEDKLKRGDYVEIKRTGEILSVETPNPILRGKPSVVRAIAAPVYNESGNVAGAIETITDITELKRAQEDLRESECRYRTIFENTGTATVLLEENTIISIANAEFERLSGYPREELEGKKSWTEFVVKEDLERMLAQHRIRRENHETALRHYEFRFVTKNGEIRNIFLTIDVIPDTKQSVASLMDITPQIRAQDAVKLANKKINLLNSITRHEILNQLTILFGFLELVRERLDDPVLVSYLEREKQAAETIRSQIEFTRDYQGIGVQSPEWQQVQKTIRNAVAVLNIGEITLSVDVGDAEIFADMLLEKVFYTLVENAVRHGVTVTKIRFTAKVTPDAFTIICEDDGTGVPAEVKGKIFRREYYQNTGFGLFLAGEILGITGITIRETGEPGNGARFEILVPNGAYRFSHQ